MPSDFTPNNVWGTTQSTDEELTLPSGQNCLAHKVRLEDMLDMGLLGEVDALTAMVSRYTKTVKGGKKSAEVDTAILGDQAAVKTMMMVADRVIPHVVISPPVALHFKNVTVGKTTLTKALTPEERAEIVARTPGTVFTDQIGLEDKFELFSWGLGGLDKLATFRQEPTANVGDVADGEGLRKPRKRAAGGN